ncbi:hypothetical protein CSUI_005168 [Cystoisospora suis]|uniref:Uncharacterized protein n=1 Tax=Cystoisospora suis TaxID=483139 RepID=A0A2C6K7T3_9APIC|nr:hypothetical protein CSUI_005168 [Cystoisospora suis]
MLCWRCLPDSLCTSACVRNSSRSCLPGHLPARSSFFRTSPRERFASGQPYLSLRIPPCNAGCQQFFTRMKVLVSYLCPEFAVIGGQ